MITSISHSFETSQIGFIVVLRLPYYPLFRDLRPFLFRESREFLRRAVTSARRARSEMFKIRPSVANGETVQKRRGVRSRGETIPLNQTGGNIIPYQPNRAPIIQKKLRAEALRSGESVKRNPAKTGMGKWLSLKKH